MAGTYVAGVRTTGAVADTTVVIVEPMSIEVSTQVTARVVRAQRMARLGSRPPAERGP